MENTNDKTAVPMPQGAEAYLFSGHEIVHTKGELQLYGAARAEEARREERARCDGPLTEMSAKQEARIAEIHERLAAQRTAGGELDELRATICGVRAVGEIDGHQVIRRDSVIELIDSRRAQRPPAASAAAPGADEDQRAAVQFYMLNPSAALFDLKARVRAQPVAEAAAPTDCTEPNRAVCPRLCQDFCNAKEEAAAQADDGCKRCGGEGMIYVEEAFQPCPTCQDLSDYDDDVSVAAPTAQPTPPDDERIAADFETVAQYMADAYPADRAAWDRIEPTLRAALAAKQAGKEA